ncbi:DsbA family protein [Xinfangfangia sp. D13-10-4-6]|uniref:DsbA family protein n=1 Tax=Pseudogemmobacter hezensis TaxID=2737662 RepID=UPI001552453F|nr:DsbA family protein [Pseudogemmobacter hezensis]NPD14860.1 DsbA family protein [Pseudogemmobacter hezensis]
MVTQITCLLDPLCGWCYGAAPALSRLAADPGLSLSLQPTGLFAGDGARPMDAGFAAYAWSNDQRIAGLTGQPFTEAYRRNVLEAGGMFDSGPATLALTAVRLTAPAEEQTARELAALHAIQKLRYVDGGNNASLPALAQVLDGFGYNSAARRVESPDQALQEACRDRMTQGRRLMAAYGANGVPALIVTSDATGRGKRQQLLNASALFDDTDSLIARLHAA